MESALQSGWLVAIAVAVIPALFGVVGNMISREARTPRDIRNLGHLADSLSKAPVGSEAHDALSALVAEYARRVHPGLIQPRKLNKTNVALTVFIILVSGAAILGLFNWIVATNGTGWSVLAIVVTVLIGLFLFLLNIAAVTTWYNEPSARKSADK
ncbi:hypothetical protein [Agromyces marinus]|uniref:DUF2721 domain-containing protein n=1 Tax=Agromyces marinus TaxID=1389020 RepID=A0ABM8H080_9MICO|nr:hypothetical protein [Agromyces marinus]BDZ54166.1 hypothetical protein GCM10025870_12390 [Agromyces marinus]